MKVKMQELESCFFFELIAENVKDAALLARFGLNRTKELWREDAYTHRNGSMIAQVIIGKSKKSHILIRRSK